MLRTYDEVYEDLLFSYF